MLSCLPGRGCPVREICRPFWASAVCRDAGTLLSGRSAAPPTRPARRARRRCCRPLPALPSQQHIIVPPTQPPIHPLTHPPSLPPPPLSAPPAPATALHPRCPPPARRPPPASASASAFQRVAARRRSASPLSSWCSAHLRSTLQRPPRSLYTSPSRPAHPSPLSLLPLLRARLVLGPHPKLSVLIFRRSHLLLISKKNHSLPPLEPRLGGDVTPQQRLVL